MENFRNKYKGKPFSFANTDVLRFIRTDKHEKWRKDERAQIFNENRNILDNSVNTIPSAEVKRSPVIENRMARLLKWKAERDLRKKLEQVKKKRPFVVGTVHHKLYSPVTKDEHVAPVNVNKKTCKSNVSVAPLVPQKRITRATEKRLLSKAQASNATNVQTKHVSPTKNKQLKTLKKKEFSFAPENHKFKPPEGLPQVPIFGRVRCTMTPVSLNECISSFSKTQASIKNDNTNLAAEQINSKMLNTSYTIKKEQDDDDTEDSIEPIVLRLSFDEEEVFHLLNKSDSGKGKNNDVNSDSDSKKNKELNIKLNEPDENKKLDNFKENKEISEKLNDNNEKRKNDEKCTNSDKKFNVTSDNIKNSYDTIHNTFKESQSSFNSNTPKSAQSNSSNELAFLSPYVVSSRGRSNVRKEQQIKRAFSLGCTINNDIPTKETVMKNLNISVDEEERTAQYFEFLLNKEIDRQMKLCEKWINIKEEPGITEDAQSQINQAIGQTNLLMNKKFKRFRSLIFDCATGKGEMLVTCNDLQGFWDMMYMEVENCDVRFEKLEQLRSRNWKEEQVSAISKPLTQKKVAKKKTMSTKSSNIRAFLAAKKQSMTEKAQSDIDMQRLGILNDNLNNTHENNENKPNDKYKSRQSVGQCDKIFTPLRHDRTRFSLLEKAQFSDIKKLRSPLTIIKISQMCKTPEIQLDDTISYINSNQTPAKSILKQSKNCNQIGSSVKGGHKFNFNDNVLLNEVVISEELQIKDLAAALDRIDKLDFDCASEEMPIHAERKLTFNDNSSEESEDTTDANKNSDLTKLTEGSKYSLMNIPSIKVQNATPLQEPIMHDKSCTPSPRRVLRKQNALQNSDDRLSSIVVSTPLKQVSELVDLNISKQNAQEHISVSDMEETTKHSENIRVLRNRSITTENTSVRKKKLSRSLCASEQEFEHKENKTPIRARRKSSVKVSIKDDKAINSKIDLHDAIAHMSLEETSRRRKSTRRSVKFAEKECSGCVERPAFPVTPHVRRSKKFSKNKEV